MTEQKEGTILIVEDEAEWRETVKRAVEEKFPNVKLLFAADFDHATNILKKQPVQILISDMRYKHGTRLDPIAGLTLYQYTKAMHYDLHYVMMSTMPTFRYYEQEVDAKEAFEHLQAAFVQKKHDSTFTEQIVAELRKIIEGGAITPRAARRAAHDAKRATRGKQPEAT